MRTDDYDRCLQSNQPYFGHLLAANQGKPRRHFYMQLLVRHESAIRAAKAMKVLEVGSWAGGSAITWANAIKQYNGGKGVVVCVDPWLPYVDPEKGELYAIMTDALITGEIFPLFKHNIRASGNESLVVSLRGPSETVLPLVRGDEFDLVYIDGDHSYGAVARDLALCASIVRDGGILCGDDLELQATQIDRGYARSHSRDDLCSDQASGINYHPGVTLAVGEFFGTDVSSWEGFWAMRRRADRWEMVVMPEVDEEPVAVPEHLSIYSRAELVDENFHGFNIIHIYNSFYALPAAISIANEECRDEADFASFVKSKGGIKAKSIRDARAAVRAANTDRIQS